MRRWNWAALTLVAALTLTACSSAGGAAVGAPAATGSGVSATSQGMAAGQGLSSPSPGSPSSGATPSGSGESSGPAVLTFSPGPDARSVRPDQAVAVNVSQGTLQSVSVTSSTGATVQGDVDATGASWRSSGALAAASTYTVTASALGTDGATVTATSRFTTLRPASTISAVITPGDDWDVGVGMPVVVTFSRAVKNRNAAQTALSVQSTPQVEGAWRWMSSTEIQWRPEEYWPSGTKVLVTVATPGVELAPGTWGRRTVTSSFSVGHQQISTVDVAKHTLTVRRDGAVIRTIPVTTGKSGFLTRGGTKVIMSRESQVRMDATTTGTDPTDPNYYNILVHWALRLTYSGEFLHAAPWSVRSQGRANVSHGCTGMSTANAKWLFDNSQVGDVVEYVGSSRPLEWGNGYTVWNKSFDAWSTPTV